VNGHETFFLNGDEYEVETSVLSALKYDRFKNSFALTELIARVSVGPLASCAACIKGEVAPLLRTQNRIICSTRRHHRSFAVAAIVDPIPSAAYTVDGRAGLRNPASPFPVRERGD